MIENSFDRIDQDIAWCPGCGNFSIRKILISALQKLSLDNTQVVMVSGIGQAAKMPQYVNTSFFNGLHGRGLPPATAIKASNPGLTVIAEGGDGDMYGEGGNHLLHAIRRNPNITLIVHDNMVYGLTKGQAAPTTMIGMETPIQVFGVFEKPINPLALAIAMDAPFVARANSGDMEQTEEILMKAIQFKGFSLVDVFQPCVTFNKLNTYKWFKEHVYYLGSEHDPTDRNAAFQRAIEEEKLPLGIFYTNTKRVPFEDNIPLYKNDKTPLFQRRVNTEQLKDLINSYAGEVS